MKRNIISALLAIIFKCQFIMGQATVAPGNTSITPAFDYLGWDITPTNPSLNIKQELALPINFYTAAGSGTFLNQRMTIFDGPGGPFNSGYVGIGTAITIPAFRIRPSKYTYIIF